MPKSILFISYISCLLLAIVYAGRQKTVSTLSSYRIESRENKEVATNIPLDNNTTTNNISQGQLPDDPAIYAVDNLFENIIDMPDAPETESYSPNSIRDFRSANPAEGVSLISAPTANSTGNAVLTFAMKLPEGRLGMQPALNIQYNNEGGNSWLGNGWNLFLPSIGIETRWGAPRYDAVLETEIYTFNGEQLAPVNNRSELIARTAEKRFYTRVEGSFNKIIRHGNSPANYWWEVTEKNGNRHFYGGRPGSGVVNSAVLKDEFGNIGYWGLTETRDPNDNFVRYVYETVEDVGIPGGTVPGKQLYLSQVLYTGSGATDGAYRVEFTRDRQLGETKRSDISIDGRLGFKMVNADLLRRVTISFNNTPIRSYEYTYEEGAFYKTLLKSISELDAAGTVFYTQEFEYYDDVNKAAYDPSTGVNTWNIAHDDIKGDLVNPIPGFTAEGSALSTSKADSRSGGVAVTVGSITGGTWTKKISVGGGFNYGEDNQEGLVSMIDINGDGLPDKVFKDGSNLFYRANLGSAARSFGDKRPIAGINDFSTSHSQNIGGGVQVLPPSGFIGYNHTRTTTTSKVYFSDFNGDGLMDIASDGRVYFNHLNAQGNPEFVTNSTLTPSPIFTGSIDQSLLGIDTALQAQQERDFPLQDIVRMWEAPFDGTVTITAPVQLVEIPNQTGIVNNKKDGVRASIQLVDNVLWSTIIVANDFTTKTPTNVNGLTVLKGQRIYFRLQSRYNGEEDLVNWDPVIAYSTPVTGASDTHHKISNYYSASADFILHSKSITGLGKTGEVVIDGTFSKNITSDSVWVVVRRKRNNVITTLFEMAYSGRQLVNGPLVPGQFPVLADDELHFLLVSRSYIDRSALSWEPHYAYVAFNDNTPVISVDGKPTLQGYPIPDNSNFNNWHYAAPAVAAPQQDTVKIWPLLNGGTSGTLWFTIKGNDTIYARRHILVTNGNMNTAIDTVRLIRQANEPLFFEFATDSLEFGRTLQQPRIGIYRDSIFLDTSGALDTVMVGDTILANLHTNPAQEYLGPLFRGWGQFVIRGDRGDGPINEDSLNLDELNGYPSDPSNYTDSASLGNIPDPSKTFFVMLYPDGPRRLWVGYDTSVYVTSGMMSSSRLYVHDVSVDSLMAGESAGAVHKISTTLTDSYSVAAAPGVQGSAGTSFASTTVDLDMLDMNGDRYPDVLNDDRIQYTLPNGGLGTTTIQQPVESTVSEGWSAGISLGGSFLEATTENTTKKGAVAAQKTAKASSGLSGSVNTNEDENVTAWIDINGDGLNDRIYKSGVVSLNLGYRFAPGEQWGTGGIDRSSSISAGAGLGVNIDAGSFDAGIGLSRTDANNSFLLNDVNGDGLPDQLTISGGQLVVRLNTGSGFGPAITWTSFHGITRNISTGESLNGSFTIGIPIPIIFIKIAINPSINIGHGVSRQQDVVMDIDGDGYADMLHSENDGQLTASGSTIGRTNMLRGVKGPLGASFTMDYQRVGNTYEMPQSKWVLSGVDIFDGVRGDGVDTMRQRFSYEGGYQDRHEREFYGFNRVISRELNTAANNIVYRSHIQQYLNTTYYNKGLLASEWTEDGSGNKISQVNNLYEPVPQQDHVQFMALKQTEKLFYEGAAVHGARTAVQYEYDALGNVTRISDGGDGSQQDMLLTNITYHDVDDLYIKSIPASVEVTTVEGVKRSRTTSINREGDVIRIRHSLADGTAVDTDMEYDSYGNLSRVARPANYKGERMWHSYEYDNAVHSYITRVTDAFGYTSTSTYDYRFGALTGTVSRNNEEVQYTWDARGRLSTLTGPYELVAGKPYTIAFSYNTNATVPYAVTRHYDPEHDADINIASFTDGLGRSIQVKKQVSMFRGKNVADDLRMVVSGKVLLDAFGRPARTFYPTTEAIGVNNFILSTALGNIASTSTYDAQDRETETLLADGSVTRMAYSIVDGFFSTMTTDALNNRKEILTDVRERKRFSKEYGGVATITTRFDYNALSELTRVVDNQGNAIEYTYDNLGRKLRVEHPDAGLTEFVYDLAGNLVKKINPQIRKEIPNGGAILYRYEYERLTDIDYPRHYQNKVKYVYGKSGTGNKAGRLILQQDATGGQEFFYGPQGEIVKTIRTVLINPVFATTYVSEQEYDTWNRLKRMIYPDGEEVKYHYNRAGGLYSMDGTKLGNTYKYVEQLGYDEYEERVYLRYGNGSETRYAYDNQRRRLTQLQTATQAGRPLLNNAYTYDAVDNVLSVVNDVQAQAGKLGGYAKYEYHYDHLYRLDAASGEFKGASDSSGYDISASYDDLNNIVQKTMDHVKDDQSYDKSYTYGSAGPHQPTEIGQDKYSYDGNGNQLGYGNVENFWDEENRLVAVLNEGTLSQYTYDAAGKRVIKSSGGIQGIWVNGTPAGAVRHRDNYAVYVSPYLLCRRTSFTKHYYIDNECIATKLGHGTFTNISFPHPGLTAGGIDYAKRAALIEQSRINYYASLGLSPGPPTDKNFWGRPENSGIPAPVYPDTATSMIPPGWPGNTTPPTTGPPIFVTPIPSNDSVKGGYGFDDPGHLYEISQFFYHADHTGSTAYVSNALGEVSQRLEYSPFGETCFEEQSGTFKTNYLYQAKGRDEETGYYHYSPRYYEPVVSQWLSVADPMGDKYPREEQERLIATSLGSVTNTAMDKILFMGGQGGVSPERGMVEDEDIESRGKPKKGAGTTTATGPRNTPVAKAAAKYTGQLQSLHNMHRKGFRQARNGVSNNGMFFNPSMPVRRASVGGK